MRQKQKQSNKVTNAQLGAWIGVVPSTIQAIRTGRYSVMSQRLEARIAAALEVSRGDVRRLFRNCELAAALENRYIKEGWPRQGITGRDFTDPGRTNPLRKGK